MKHFTLISAILGLSAALCSCTEKDDTNLNAYQWGVYTTSNQYSGPENENLLYTEAKQEISKFNEKYSGSGLFSSDASALEKSNREAALKAYDAMETKINERIKIVDNYGHSFKLVTKYYISKNNTLLGDEVSKTFEMKSDKFARFDEYTTVTQIPLTDELQKKDPASYPVTINLVAAGIDFDDIDTIQYDSVKVYASSTREINSSLTFISGGSASLNNKTLSLTFTGTSSALASMKGQWYANAYITITGLGSSQSGIVRVPFTVK